MYFKGGLKLANYPIISGLSKTYLATNLLRKCRSFHTIKNNVPIVSDLNVIKDL